MGYESFTAIPTKVSQFLSHLLIKVDEMFLWCTPNLKLSLYWCIIQGPKWIDDKPSRKSKFVTFNHPVSQILSLRTDMILGQDFSPWKSLNWLKIVIFAWKSKILGVSEIYFPWNQGNPWAAIMSVRRKIRFTCLNLVDKLKKGTFPWTVPCVSMQGKMKSRKLKKPWLVSQIRVNQNGSWGKFCYFYQTSHVSDVLWKLNSKIFIRIVPN